MRASERVVGKSWGDTLLREYAAVQTEAAWVGFQAPTREARPTPFRRRGQLTAGFGY